MYENVPIINRGKLQMNSTFTFVYIMSFIYISIYEIYHFIFVMNYHEKKIRKFNDEEKYDFPVNNKTFLKGFLTIFSLFLIYIFFGFLGVLFLFYFFTQINIFHKYKTLSIIYNIYIKTVVHFCGVSNIHNINFTKL